MKYLDFEKHIKSELEQAKEPVQMDALLQALDLGKKPKRNGFVFWMIIPFLLLVFSALAWKFIDIDKSTGNEALSSAEVEQVSGANDDGNSKVITSNTPTETSEFANLSSQTVETDVNTISNTLPSRPQDIPSIAGSNSTTSSLGLGTPIIEKSKNKTNKTKTTFSNVTPIHIQNATENSQQNLNTLETSDLNSSYILKSNSTTSIQNESLNSMATTAASQSRGLLNLESLQSLDLVFDLDDEDVVADENLFSRMRINCPSFDNPRWHLALVPEIGAFIPFKTIMRKSTENPDGFTQRLNSETTLEGLELGLHGMLVRDNIPFYIKAGVTYSRISERMDLKYEYTEQDTTIGIISSTVSANGDTITHIYGEVIEETTFKGSNRQHHYVHLFDIPVSIGYTTYIGGLDVGIEGGVKVNFMTRGTGNLLTSDANYTNLSLNRLFKNRIGVSYFGGLMLGRNFGKYGDFYLAPRFHYYPNDFTNSENNVSQEYFSVGLSAGFVYKIN